MSGSDAGPARAEVMTVLGPLDAAEMGITAVHEHVLVDLYDMHGASALDGILGDPDVAADELSAFRAAGGRTIVDTTSIGIGRDPAGLAKVAAAAGVNIVMGTGWYREAVYPRDVLERTSDELAAMLVDEIEHGVGDTGIRPGIIGELGTERNHITSAQERVFRAAALAHLATGLTIATHTSHLGELAVEQLAMLTAFGVPPERVVIGHMGDHRNVTVETALLERGAYIGIDHVGWDGILPDAARADTVAALVEAGHGDRILLGSDTAFRSHLRAFGGRGYDHLLRMFVPLLREREIPEEAIEAMLVDNPRRAIARDRSAAVA